MSDLRRENAKAVPGTELGAPAHTCDYGHTLSPNSTEWRAAEVVRLRDELAAAEAKIDRLHAENAAMRKVVEAARFAYVPLMGLAVSVKWELDSEVLRDVKASAAQLHAALAHYDAAQGEKA